MEFSRRNFIRLGALSSISSLVFTRSKAESFIQKEWIGSEKNTFELGMAGYSFVNFNLDDSLKMMKRMDIRYLCIKDFHLPLNSNAEQIAAFHQKLSESNVKGYAVGPIYMTKSKTEIDNAFDYAKRVGVDLIIGIPNKEDLEYISKKTEEYNIRYALHNHGPEDKLYPNAKSIHDLINHLSPKMGICFDMGHNMRDAREPSADLKSYHKRIFDIHLKNVTEATEKGSTCELGRGVIDIPKFVKTLRSVGYSGKCSLEFEKDMKDPLAGIAESKGYFQGVCDAIK